MALGLFVVATYAVHEIRGKIFGHLVAWISVLGFIAWAALAAALVPAPPAIGASAVVVLAVRPLLALTLHAGGRQADGP